MGSKIKGGGRAIINEENQEALIDLLISIEREKNSPKEVPDISCLSLHDKKRTRKQFMKKLLRRHEQAQLRQKHYAAARVSNEPPNISNASSGASPNVRVELAEAIFSKDKEKKDKKKIKDDKAKSKKKKSDEGFKIGTKKVIVVPRTTPIPELLKQSQSKLKMKKKPICVFLQPSASVLFELKDDLGRINDGTVIYVSASPLPTDKKSSDDEAASSCDGEDQDAIDPLEEIKLAYQRQEISRHHQQQCQRMNEIVNPMEKSKHTETRSKLPVASHKQYILETIRNNDVVILSGSTGSGKSTQVPQFLLENETAHDSKRPYIVVTQPRRVAAISLAQRVASERGCPRPGSKGSSVGYKVRLDYQVDLRSCRIVYMTIGILLRMLVQHQPQKIEQSDADMVCQLSINTISHLIIDEVHERDVNTDFALTLLKNMMSLKSSPAMPRLILMSATTSAELFVNYFTVPGKAPPLAINIPGRTFPVDINWLSACEKYVGKHLMQRQQVIDNNLPQSSSCEPSSNGIALSPRSKDRIDNEFIRALITQIIQKDFSNDSGAILVFLPGLGEIDALARCLSEKDHVTCDASICTIFTLHSTTAKADQTRVFQPSSIVKIVLSTNIAETSLTIPDVSHVIDTCLVKESRYNSESRIKELITVWTTHASMKQRAGRAGRTSHGTCWRLCSEQFATEHLLQHTLPEIVRTPLDELVLQVCLLYEQRRDSSNNPTVAGLKPIKFLSATPTPPSEQNCNRACQHLLEVDALIVVDYGDADSPSNWMYRLTPLGYHLSRLPMDAKVGKLLVIGCILGCLENALTIAAALSCTKSCFLRHSREKPLDSVRTEARDSLIERGFGGRDWLGSTVKGDLFAVIAIFREWKKQRKSDRGKFCWDHALDSFAIQELDCLRDQFNELVIDAGLASPDPHDKDNESNITNADALLTSCCLVAGLYPNICTLIRPSKGGLKAGKLLTKENDACRPSSNSFQGKRVKNASEIGKDVYAVYHSKHQTINATSQAGKHVSETFLSEVNFISKFTLLLFGGRLELVNNALIVDDWLKFKVSNSDGDKSKGGTVNNAVLIISLRTLLDDLILEHVQETFSPDDKKTEMVLRHKRVIDVVRKLISDEIN